MSLDAPEWLHPGDHIFSPRRLGGCKLYWAAVVQLDDIFAKPGGLQRVNTCMTEWYYKYLLRAKDLTELQELGDEVVQLNDHKMKERLPLQDDRRKHKTREDDQDMQEVPALQWQPAPPPPVLLPPAAPVPVTREYKAKTLKVYFDRGQKPRAFIHCTLHDGCRLYRYIHTYPSREHAIAFLMAWAMNPEEAPDAETHVPTMPNKELVTEIYNSLLT